MKRRHEQLPKLFIVLLNKKCFYGKIISLKKVVLFLKEVLYISLRLFPQELKNVDYLSKFYKVVFLSVRVIGIQE